VDLDACVMDKFPLDPGKGSIEEAKVLSSPFVILHHTGHISQDRGDHWDWLIQIPEYFLAELAPRMQANQRVQTHGLLSFASEIHPNQWSEGTLFWRLAPHRPVYLEYQGEVSQGRGRVKRIASGQLHWIFMSDFRLSFRLFRLGWLDDHQEGLNFGGASTNPSLGQYSLIYDRLTCKHSDPSPTPLPWTSSKADTGAYWRLSG
jgi:hypothetical protein